jgi:hypothetical protein
MVVGSVDTRNPAHWFALRGRRCLQQDAAHIQQAVAASILQWQSLHAVLRESGQFAQSHPGQRRYNDEARRDGKSNQSPQRQKSSQDLGEPLTVDERRVFEPELLKHSRGGDLTRGNSSALRRRLRISAFGLL